MIRPCTKADTPRIEAIINDAAEQYRGFVPTDCLHDPYMSMEVDGRVGARNWRRVRFWGWQDDQGQLLGVMGIQQVRDAL